MHDWKETSKDIIIQKQNNQSFMHDINKASKVYIYQKTFPFRDASAIIISGTKKGVTFYS